MSSRYDDTDRERYYDRPGRNEREVNEREPGRGVRQDVRETGRDIREAGGDIVSNLCGFWGNVLGSLGDAISPQSNQGRSSARTSSRDEEEDDGRESPVGLFNCLGSEFSFRCGRSESGGRRSFKGDENRDDSPAGRTRGDRASARISGRNTEIDVNT